MHDDFTSNRCPHCGGDLQSNNDETVLPATKNQSLPATSPDNMMVDQPTVKPATSPSRPHAEVPQHDFGNYELLEEIARGGMGVVFKARQKNLDRLVALKMILEGQLASQVEIDRFKIEAQAAAQLDHPGIVPVYDHGQVDGRHYFAMGFVDGSSLDQRIKTQPVHDEEAAQLMVKIATAVDYAHQRNIIHRDLKPANILIDDHGNPRIADFGLAKRRNRESQLTIEGQVLGTPSFMAPEQASGRDVVTHSADIYALGAILYAILTGRPPFEGATIVETITSVIEQEPVQPSQVVSHEISKDLETICLKCLEKDPRDRYLSATELLDELKRFLGGEPILARPLSGLEKVLRWRKIVARNNDVRLQSATRLFGVPMVDIAFGRNRDRTEETGHAKGIIAFGDKATGVLAFGGYARGLFAFGMCAVGVITFGTFSMGLFCAGLFSLGIFSGGGLSIGVFSSGLFAIGYKAIGLFSLGFETSLGAYRWGPYFTR